MFNVNRFKLWSLNSFFILQGSGRQAEFQTRPNVYEFKIASAENRDLDQGYGSNRRKVLIRLG